MPKAGAHDFEVRILTVETRVPMKRAALLSVSDRTGITDLSKALIDDGFTLIATSGTGKILAEHKIPFVPIDTHTGFPEMLDGRVKTLHPKIHGGILARRDKPEHLKQLDEHGLIPIDLVVVNLYPFAAGLEQGKNYQEMVELIDVGGPSMIRAAAKNHRDVLVASDPADYSKIIEALSESAGGGVGTLELRRYCAAKAFGLLSQYDGMIAGYLRIQDGSSQELPSSIDLPLVKKQSLRYGENPHQKAAFYHIAEADSSWKILSGKELSYNNMLDVDAALSLVVSLGKEEPSVSILKHLNPCGISRALDQLTALNNAKRCDPRSHFGGIIAFNQQVTAEAAANVREDFAEIVVAPDYTDEAISILRTSKNLRIITFEWNRVAAQRTELRSALDGYLVQERDRRISRVGEAELVTSHKATAQELKDLDLAWIACAHVKSNSIVLAKDGLIVGVGAGQMSRIDSVELAIQKATFHGHSLKGAVCASDAFFPFSDSIMTLAAAGISAIISPSGAKRDDEVRAAAEEKKMALYFAGDRHFRH